MTMGEVEAGGSAGIVIPAEAMQGASPPASPPGTATGAVSALLAVGREEPAPVEREVCGSEDDEGEAVHLVQFVDGLPVEAHHAKPGDCLDERGEKEQGVHDFQPGGVLHMTDSPLGFRALVRWCGREPWCSFCLVVQLARHG